MPASIVSSICEDKCRSRRIQLRDLNAEAKLKDGDDLTAVQDFYVAEMTNKQGQWRRPAHRCRSSNSITRPVEIDASVAHSRRRNVLKNALVANKNFENTDGFGAFGHRRRV